MNIYIALFTIAAASIMVPSAVRAQGAAYSGTVRSSTGQVVAGADVAVCDYPATSTIPCTPAALLFSDEGLSQAITNPVVTNSSGAFSFFARPGTYVIQSYGTGIATQAFTITLPPAADNIAGVYRVGSPKYPCTATGINAAIVAATEHGQAAGSGGFVDARACVGTVTMNAPIVVGNSSLAPVTLELPTGAVWTFTVSGSNSCDIEQFPNTVIQGPGVGDRGGGGGGLVGKMMIEPSGADSPYAYFCTSAAVGRTSAYGYFRASGFMVYNPGEVVTQSGYAITIKAVADNSVFSNIEVADGTNNGFLIANGCCGASFYNLTANEEDTGGVALTVGQQTEEGDHDVNFFGGSFDHARPGKNEILFNEPPYTGGPVNFFGTYVEGNTKSPDTVSLIDTGPNGVALGLHFYGITVFPMHTETVYGIHTSAGQHVELTASGMYMRSFMDVNAIDDERHGVKIVADNYGHVPSYDSVGFQTPRGLSPVTAEAGKVNLVAGYGTATITFASTPICTATDITAPNAVRVAATPTTLIVTGSGSDIVSYICIGNPD